MNVLLLVELLAQKLLRTARAHRGQPRHAGRHVREHGAARHALHSGTNLYFKTENGKFLLLSQSNSCVARI